MIEDIAVRLDIQDTRVRAELEVLGLRVLRIQSVPGGTQLVVAGTV